MNAGHFNFFYVMGKKIKYRRLGPDSHWDLLTRCSFAIWSVYWSPVKMDCLCVNVQFMVACSMVALSFHTLIGNIGIHKRLSPNYTRNKKGYQGVYDLHGWNVWLISLLIVFVVFRPFSSWLSYELKRRYCYFA